MNRRDVLYSLGAAAGAPLWAGAGRVTRDQASAQSPGAQPMPVVFVAHGAPPLLDEPAWVAELAAWPGTFPRPSSILVVSAHWEHRPTTLGATEPRGLIYDFYGFPERYYHLAYRSPGAPALASRVRALLEAGRIDFAEDPQRGLDHGAYIPLMCMVPDASVPVLSMSLPSLNPTELWDVGRALAPLRREGVLIVGSGFLTHNLRRMGGTETPRWASEFDHWIAEVLVRRDIDALLDYRRRGPGVDLALPTHEHFAPVVLAAGAASDGPDDVTFPITGFWYGSLTRRSVQFG